MASDGEEEDLEQLRNAVFASMKNSKSKTEDDKEEDSEEDDELFALRKAALLSKKPSVDRSENSQSSSDRSDRDNKYHDEIEKNINEVTPSQRTDERKVVRSRVAQNNLIVINTVEDVLTKPPDFQNKLLLPQDKWVGSSDEKSATSTPTRKGLDKFSRYESNSDSDESSSSSDSSDEDVQNKDKCDETLQNFNDFKKSEIQSDKSIMTMEKIRNLSVEKIKETADPKKLVTDVSKTILPSNSSNENNSASRNVNKNVSALVHPQKPSSKENVIHEISSDTKTSSDKVQNFKENSVEIAQSVHPSKPVSSENSVKNSPVSSDNKKLVSSAKQIAKPESNRLSHSAKNSSSDKNSEELKSNEKSRHVKSSLLIKKPRNQSPHRDRSPISKSRPLSPSNSKQQVSGRSLKQHSAVSKQRTLSPVTKERKLSPTSKLRQRSPSVKSMQRSPTARSTPRSPTSRSQRSPTSRSQRSPTSRSQRSPTSRSQRSPTSRSQRSPTLKSQRSPTSKSTQRSTSSRSTQRSPTLRATQRLPTSRLPQEKREKSPLQRESQYKSLHPRSPSRSSSSLAKRSRSPIRRTSSSDIRKNASDNKKLSVSSRSEPSSNLLENAKHEKDKRMLRECDDKNTQKNSNSKASKREDELKRIEKKKTNNTVTSKSTTKETVSLKGNLPTSKRRESLSSSSESSSSESSSSESSSSSSSSRSADKKKKLKDSVSSRDSKKTALDKSRSRDIVQSTDRQRYKPLQHSKNSLARKSSKSVARKVSESSSSSSDSSSSSSESDSDSEEESWRNKKQRKTERQKEDIERERKQRLQAERAKKAQMWKALQELKSKDTQSKGEKYSSKQKDSHRQTEERKPERSNTLGDEQFKLSRDKSPKSFRDERPKSFREERWKREKSVKDDVSVKEKRPLSAIQRSSGAGRKEELYTKNRPSKAWDERKSTREVREWDRGKQDVNDLSDNEHDYKVGRWKSFGSEFNPRERREKFSPVRKRQRDYEWEREDRNSYRNYDKKDNDSAHGYRKREEEDRKKQSDKKQSDKERILHKEKSDGKQKSNKSEKNESINERLARIANMELDEKWTASGERKEDKDKSHKSHSESRKQYNKYRDSSDSSDQGEKVTSDRSKMLSARHKDTDNKGNMKENSKVKADKKKLEDDFEEDIVPAKRLLTSVVSSSNSTKAMSSKSKYSSAYPSYLDEKEPKQVTVKKTEASNKRVVVTLDQDIDSTVKDARQHLSRKKPKLQEEDKGDSQRTVKSLRKITISNQSDQEQSNSDNKVKVERKSVHDRLGLPVDNQTVKKKKREIHIQSEELKLEQFKSSKDLSKEGSISKTITNTEAAAVKRTVKADNSGTAEKESKEVKAEKTKYDSDLDARIKRIQQRNQEILRRQQEIEKDKETYG